MDSGEVRRDHGRRRWVPFLMASLTAIGALSAFAQIKSGSTFIDVQEGNIQGVLGGPNLAPVPQPTEGISQRSSVYQAYTNALHATAHLNNIDATKANLALLRAAAEAMAQNPDPSLRAEAAALLLDIENQLKTLDERNPGRGTTYIDLQQGAIEDLKGEAFQREVPDPTPENAAQSDVFSAFEKAVEASNEAKNSGNAVQAKAALEAVLDAIEAAADVMTDNPDPTVVEEVGAILEIIDEAVIDEGLDGSDLEDVQENIDDQLNTTLQTEIEQEQDVSPSQP